jgi:hypothetical protein
VPLQLGSQVAGVERDRHDALISISARFRLLCAEFEYLGHFYLAKLLLSMLLSTAKTAKVARVINTSSLTSDMFSSGKINFDTLKEGPARMKAGSRYLYN